MSAWLVRWRLALRIARRDARRHKGRTLLVVLMVGLPVLTVVTGDTLLRTWQVSPVEALVTLGSADARIEGIARSPIVADPLTGDPIVFDHTDDEPAWTAAEIRELLPAGAAVAERAVGELAYRTDAGEAGVAAIADDLADPLRADVVEIVAGRAPRDAGEVAVSDAVAGRGVAVGSNLEVVAGGGLEVVGVVRSGAGEPLELAVVAPEDAGLLTDARTEFFASVPGGLDWPAVQELNAVGLAVVSRAVVADPPLEEEYRPPAASDTAEVAVLALIVTGILLEIVLLAGPAFAVGLRRQRRDLALLAATGGSPADLRRTVLASGVVLGGGAAVGGALLGIGLAWLALPLMRGRTDVRFGPFDVAAFDVLAVVVTGLVAGLAAAAVPARQAARTDVVTALDGRRGQVRTSWRLPVAGLGAVAAGAALTVLGARGSEFGGAAGAVLLIAGTVTAMPWLVGLLAPLARRLPTAGLIAVRDATRNRTRTSAAVAAVMATVAAVTTMAIASQSDSAQSRRDYVAQAPMGTAVVTGNLAAAEPATLEARLTAQVPDRPVHLIRGTSAVPTADGGMRDPDLVPLAAGCTSGANACRWSPPEAAVVSTGFMGNVTSADPGATVVTARFGEVVVAGASVLRGIARGDLPPAVLEALADGRVAVFGSGAVDGSGEVTLAAVEYDETGRTSVVADAALPAVGVPLPPGRQVEVPGLVLVPPALAHRLPVSLDTTALVVGGPDAPVTPAEERALTEVVRAYAPEASVYVERGWTDELSAGRLVLLIVGGVLVLVATLTATGLAIADARPDLATLAAIGAAPRTRRFIAMCSAAVIGVGGAVLGLLVGAGPGIAVAYPLTSTDYGMGARPLIDVPWLLLGAVAVAVPLVAIAVTGLFVRSRLPMAHRMG